MPTYNHKIRVEYGATSLDPPEWEDMADRRQEFWTVYGAELRRGREDVVFVGGMVAGDGLDAAFEIEVDASSWDHAWIIARDLTDRAFTAAMADARDRDDGSPVNYLIRSLAISRPKRGE